MNSLIITIGYFVIINILGFALMGIDKRKARTNAFRIPEATLFTIAILGGSIGSTAGMHVFRHKTKHWYFKFGMPIIIVLQAILVGLFIWLPIELSFI
ncbi:MULTISPECIES: DUF1294 domain-containing protein [unclassified Butyrivibrio]|uniref:DUF1294 domain-containing protein n=1 Tax=unclassified Butyrivibrio TaxID=2639466 RepID=UPI0003B50A2C|nr:MULTISPECIES: DUF1294 domain-containing protein [unclassified Butyrivibrio]MDC7294103.1 DUF1294 domain-containing protein [Butyrivibrio sp. DSM 10294]